MIMAPTAPVKPGMADLDFEQSSGMMDSDQDDEPQIGPEASAKSAIRAAIFDQWIVKMYDQLQQKSRTSKGKADTELSMHDLLSQNETKKITDPRDYQTELFERAKNQNTIAVLPTGSGKTLIAVLLLRHILDIEAERRALAANTPDMPSTPRHAFFLVTTTTLVFQQYAVLECNLDHKVEKLYGTMDNSLWLRQTWDGILKDTMVIVCTADILYECLYHSYVDMGKINIIIFDEAHHAKQNAAYAKIMHGFYHKWENKAQRPKIFGMTASPVDTKDADIRLAADSLERLLDSNIATVKLADEFVSHAEEHVCYYHTLQQPFETELWHILHDKFGHVPGSGRLFETAKRLGVELGSWAADYFWTFAFSDEAASKMAKRAEKLETGDKSNVEELDHRIALLDEAQVYVNSFDFTSGPPLQSPDLSSKTLVLYNLLMMHYDAPTAGRCIIFVQTRAAARLLHHIFSLLQGPHLRVGLLTGAGRGNFGAETQSFRKQVETLLDFRKGALNCLFATSVAEEGLDIPSCNLVIRFDLYNSMIGYVQSRGRARHKNSKFYHMVERGNAKHHDSVVEARGAAAKMASWCTSLSSDRVLKGLDADLPDGWDDELVDTESGATLNTHNALSILAYFVDSVQVPSHLESSVAYRPQYIVTGSPGAWICEVILPPHCVVERALGKMKSRKSMAKRSAAFELCKELRSKGYLDKHFLLKEEMRKIGPMMRNARIGIRNDKLAAYDCILKPRVWVDYEKSLPTQVHLAVFSFSASLDRPHQPLGILTRQALPPMPEFPIYLVDGSVRHVSVNSQPTSISCDMSLLENAAGFTSTILADVYRKDFEVNPCAMPYWIVPVQMSESAPFQICIDMLVLGRVAENEPQRWTQDMQEGTMENRFLVDLSAARRIFSTGVDKTKKPDDPVPEGVPRMRFARSILDYSNTLWKKSRDEQSDTWIHDQPVVEGTQVTFWQNILAQPSDKVKREPRRVWICPQFFRISKLPTEVVVAALTFPAIIHRVEEYLVALEGARHVGLHLDSSLALEAFTKNSDKCETAVGEETVRFRSGMGPNYERLEFLGDCFLKMATSLSLFVAKPYDDELAFHVSRMLMLCNQNLRDQALDLKLYEYFRSRAFDRHGWYPPGMKMIHGKGAEKINKQADDNRVAQQLADKTFADVCESLIGAAFVQHNRPGYWAPEHWDAAVGAVTLFVRSDDHKMIRWQDYADAYVVPEYLKMPCRSRDYDLANKVKIEHDYEFKQPRLVSCAFKHPSEPASDDRIPSYQQLEFLGDSLLDMAAVSSLYYRYPDKDPQWLTEHKMAIASNQFLAALCVKIGFHRHLRPWSEAVRSQVTEWALDITEAARSAGPGEVNYWTMVSSPPKCLADIVEAYVGAIFVDSGFNFGVVQRFYEVNVAPFFEDMSLYDTFANNHPITKLQAKLSLDLGCRDFKLMSKEIPQELPSDKPRVVAALMIHDKIVAWEVRESGGYANVAASKTAFSMLDGLFRVDYRRIYACDCEAHSAEDEEDPHNIVDGATAI